MREAEQRLGEVPAGRPKAVLCAGGLRSSTVISVLKRRGADGPWYNVTGGMTAWQKAGYPVVR
jgi:hydroxyacylglutathione hydrolase